MGSKYILVVDCTLSMHETPFNYQETYHTGTQCTVFKCLSLDY